jgi:ABC-type transport system substrate-binding protein
MSGAEERLNGVLDARLNRRTLAKGAAGLAAAAPVALRGGASALAQEASPVPTKGGELRLVLADSPNVNLNVIGVTTLDAFYVASLLYDGLVTNKSDFSGIEPGLAETWDISEDGLTFTFHLRQGVKWHDGELFKAEDVEFTYLTLLNPAVGSYMAADLKQIEGAQDFIDGKTPNVSGIKVIDDATISFTVTAPNVAFLTGVLTQHSLIPKHYWSTFTTEQIATPATWESGQVGTGPFKFGSYEPDRFLQFDRNDDGWRGAPLLDRILFVYVGTAPETQAAALESGDLDYVSIPGSEYERMKTLPNLVVSTKPVLNVRFLGVNCAKPYLSDKRVRQAIAHAIDRAGISETIMAPIATANNTVTPQPLWADPNVPVYEYDPDKAKALLQEAGWDPSQQIELALYYQDQQHKDAMAYAQQQLGEAGINATVVQLDGSAVQAYYYSDAKFDVMLAGYGMGPDFNDFSHIFKSDATWPGGQNAMKYANPRVDELFDLGVTTSDEAQRHTYYNELQEILVDELPWIPFYQLNVVGGFNVRVHNADAIFNVWNRRYNWHAESIWVDPA